MKTDNVAVNTALDALVITVRIIMILHVVRRSVT